MKNERIKIVKKIENQYSKSVVENFKTKNELKYKEVELNETLNEYNETCSELEKLLEIKNKMIKQEEENKVKMEEYNELWIKTKEEIEKKKENFNKFIEKKSKIAIEKVKSDLNYKIEEKNRIKQTKEKVVEKEICLSKTNIKKYKEKISKESIEITYPLHGNYTDHKFNQIYHQWGSNVDYSTTKFHNVLVVKHNIELNPENENFDYKMTEEKYNDNINIKSTKNEKNKNNKHQNLPISKNLKNDEDFKELKIKDFFKNDIKTQYNERIEEDDKEDENNPISYKDIKKQRTKSNLKKFEEDLKMKRKKTPIKDKSVNRVENEMIPKTHNNFSSKSNHEKNYLKKNKNSNKLKSEIIGNEPQPNFESIYNLINIEYNNNQSNLNTQYKEYGTNYFKGNNNSNLYTYDKNIRNPNNHISYDNDNNESNYKNNLDENSYNNEPMRKSSQDYTNNSSKNNIFEQNLIQNFFYNKDNVIYNNLPQENYNPYKELLSNNEKYDSIINKIVEDNNSNTGRISENSKYSDFNIKNLQSYSQNSNYNYMDNKNNVDKTQINSTTQKIKTLISSKKEKSDSNYQINSKDDFIVNKCKNGETNNLLNEMFEDLKSEIKNVKKNSKEKEKNEGSMVRNKVTDRIKNDNIESNQEKVKNENNDSNLQNAKSKDDNWKRSKKDLLEIKKKMLKSKNY